MYERARTTSTTPEADGARIGRPRPSSRRQLSPASIIIRSDEADGRVNNIRRVARGRHFHGGADGDGLTEGGEDLFTFEGDQSPRLALLHLLVADAAVVISLGLGGRAQVGGGRGCQRRLLFLPY